MRGSGGVRSVRWNVAGLALPLLLTGLSPAIAGAQATGRIEGIVLDAESGERVPDVTLQLQAGADGPGDAGPSPTEVSGPLGRFLFDRVPPGAYRLVARHISYGVSADTLTVAAAEAVTVEYRVSARPIEIAGLSVTARATRVEAERRRGTRVDGMTAAEVDAVRPRISSMSDLLRAGNVPGFTVTELGSRVCVESNRSRGGVQSLPGQCAMVTVVVDDVIQTDAQGSLAVLSPEVVESWELLPALEAGTRFGSISGNGVLEIRTRLGARPGQGFEGLARVGHRWAVSGSVVANGSTTLHEGVVQVSSSAGAAALSYVERTNTSAGAELSVRWNSRSFGFLGITGYGSWGSSGARYVLGAAGERVAERDHATAGLDVWWGAPLLRRGAWNANLALGPSFQWQSLSIDGHPNELADPGATQPPPVEWSDRSWFAPGAAFYADLGYDFGLNAGVWAGISFRLLSTSGTSAWAEQDQDAIFEATGRVNEVTYDTGIAASLGLRTGLRWYP